MAAVNRLLVAKHFRPEGADGTALAVQDFTFPCPVVLAEIRVLAAGVKNGSFFTGETQEEPFSLEIFANNLDKERAPFEALTRGTQSVAVKKGARITRIKDMRTSHMAFRGKYRTLSVCVYGRNPTPDANATALKSVRLPDLGPSLVVKAAYLQAEAKAWDPASLFREVDWANADSDAGEITLDLRALVKIYSSRAARELPYEDVVALVNETLQPDAEGAAFHVSENWGLTDEVVATLVERALRKCTGRAEEGDVRLAALDLGVGYFSRRWAWVSGVGDVVREAFAIVAAAAEGTAIVPPPTVFASLHLLYLLFLRARESVLQLWFAKDRWYRALVGLLLSFGTWASVVKLVRGLLLFWHTGVRLFRLSKDVARLEASAAPRLLDPLLQGLSALLSAGHRPLSHPDPCRLRLQLHCIVARRAHRAGFADTLTGLVARSGADEDALTTVVVALSEFQACGFLERLTRADPRGCTRLFLVLLKRLATTPPRGRLLLLRYCPDPVPSLDGYLPMTPDCFFGICLDALCAAVAAKALSEAGEERHPRAWNLLLRLTTTSMGQVALPLALLSAGSPDALLPILSAAAASEESYGRRAALVVLGCVCRGPGPGLRRLLGRPAQCELLRGVISHAAQAAALASDEPLELQIAWHAISNLQDALPPPPPAPLVCLPDRLRGLCLEFVAVASAFPTSAALFKLPAHELRPLIGLLTSVTLTAARLQHEIASLDPRELAHTAPRPPGSPKTISPSSGRAEEGLHASRPKAFTPDSFEGEPALQESDEVGRAANGGDSPSPADAAGPAASDATSVERNDETSDSRSALLEPPRPAAIRVHAALRLGDALEAFCFRIQALLQLPHPLPLVSLETPALHAHLATALLDAVAAVLRLQGQLCASAAGLVSSASSAVKDITAWVRRHLMSKERLQTILRILDTVAPSAALLARTFQLQASLPRLRRGIGEGIGGALPSLMSTSAMTQTPAVRSFLLSPLPRAALGVQTAGSSLVGWLCLLFPPRKGAEWDAVQTLTDAMSRDPGGVMAAGLRFWCLTIASPVAAGATAEPERPAEKPVVAGLDDHLLFTWISHVLQSADAFLLDLAAHLCHDAFRRRRDEVLAPRLLRTVLGALTAARTPLATRVRVVCFATQLLDHRPFRRELQAAVAFPPATGESVALAKASLVALEVQLNGLPAALTAADDRFLVRCRRFLVDKGDQVYFAEALKLHPDMARDLATGWLRLRCKRPTDPAPPPATLALLLGYELQTSPPQYQVNYTLDNPLYLLSLGWGLGLLVSCAEKHAAAGNELLPQLVGPQLAAIVAHISRRLDFAVASLPSITEAQTQVLAHLRNLCRELGAPEPAEDDGGPQNPDPSGMILRAFNPANGWSKLEDVYFSMVALPPARKRPRNGTDGEEPRKALKREGEG